MNLIGCTHLNSTNALNYLVMVLENHSSHHQLFLRTLMGVTILPDKTILRWDFKIMTLFIIFDRLTDMLLVSKSRIVEENVIQVFHHYDGVHLSSSFFYVKFQVLS